LVLFEDWLEELEEEIISEIKKTPDQDPAVLAEGLGLSKSGTTFQITKLKREEGYNLLDCGIKNNTISSKENGHGKS